MAMPASVESYERKKSEIINQYANILAEGKKDLGLQKDSSNLFRERKATHTKIDLRAFSQVISIDPIGLWAEIEAMASYESIVKETLKLSCLPSVVPELKSITIGGALSGVGIESSSFRYGLVHESIFEYEILLGDGRIVTARADNEYKDLFYAFPNSYGTLGYALKVKVKLIPVKSYVKITHHAFQDPKKFFENIEKTCQEANVHGHAREQGSRFAYIDGVIFNKKEMYLSLGEFVDHVPYLSNYQYLNIYYRSIQKKKEDYLSTSDYIWRWDSDWFWCSKNFFMQNFVMRLLFGKWVLHSKSFWKIRNFFIKNSIGKTLARLFQGPSESVIQDIQLPIHKAEIFLDFFEKNIGISPIWVCPVQPSAVAKSYSLYAMDPKILYLNFGFWDAVPSTHPTGYFNQKIEEEVLTLQGFKSLYSSSYYSAETFWHIYDKQQFERLKDRYDPQRNLKDLYQKCVQKL